MSGDMGISELRSEFRGALIQPGDPNYDRERALYNAMIDKRPALIARCSDVADVMTAVKFARQRELTVALETMRAAAALESATEKHPLTPGEVLPARELLADVLLAAGEYRDAQQAYEQSLARSPNRLNRLHGAVRAAQLAGDKAKAAAFSDRLSATKVRNGQ